jgi:hypothetical protein
VSNGENVTLPKVSMDSVSYGKILSKSENLSNPETLKTIFCQTCITIHRAITIGYNVGSYTQGRIAGYFLSSRKTA